MFWGTFFETLHGMKELQLGVLKGYNKDMFRAYAPDVKSFMEAKEVPNHVTVCVEKIRHPGTSSNQREVDLMKSLLPESEWKNIKITLISPSWYHFRYMNGRAYPKEVYANDEEYFEDVAKAYQEELKILHSQGIRNIQIDDPNLAYFCSDDMLAGWKADTTNDKSADEMFDSYVRFYNKCFERPTDMHLGIHLCRGNYVGSRHFSEGAYDNIAKKLFQVCPSLITKKKHTDLGRTSTSIHTTLNTTHHALEVSSHLRISLKIRMSYWVSSLPNSLNSKTRMR